MLFRRLTLPALLALVSASCIRSVPAPVPAPTAEPAPIPAAPEVPPVLVETPRALAKPTVPEEARAIWVPRWDWGTPEGIARIMERAASANFNIVYFQVRANADAYYPSSIEPCAAQLCGRLGGTLTWDPLDVAVREAHARGLELHAWLNALPGWRATYDWTCAQLRPSEPGNPQHILLEHPEYAMVNEGGTAMPCPHAHKDLEYVYLSPAYPEVRTRLARVAADVVRRYKVDGVHLDRTRYPGRQWSYDRASLDGFGRNPRSNPELWEAYRRDLVNSMVRETRDSINAARPGLPLSAAVWPIYDRRTFAWAASSSGVSQFFQDPRAWAREGYLDVAAPMTYFTLAEQRCTYRPNNPDWLCLMEEQVQGMQEQIGRHLYVGIAPAMPQRKTIAEVESQVLLARQRGAKGLVFWSYGDVERLRLWEPLRQGVFRERAAVPRMDWLLASDSVPSGARDQRTAD